MPKFASCGRNELIGQALLFKGVFEIDQRYEKML